MKRLTHLALALLTLTMLLGHATAQDEDAPEGYVPATELLPLPEFIPGAGALYIQPDDAPVGPWLAYGQEGDLIEVLFMLPVSAFEEATDWSDLAAGTLAELEAGPVDHVDVTYNPGHPGMAEAHYHFRLVLVDGETQDSALNP